MSDEHVERQNEGFDLSVEIPPAEAEGKGIWVSINDMEGAPLLYGDRLPVRVRVAGSYSKLHRGLTHAQTTKAVRLKTTNITGELIAGQQLAVVAGCILEWEGFFEGPENPMACNKVNAIRVLEGFPHILEQLEPAIGDHEAFSKANSSL